MGVSSIASRSCGKTKMRRRDDSKIGGHVYLYFGLVDSCTRRNCNCRMFFRSFDSMERLTNLAWILSILVMMLGMFATS